MCYNILLRASLQRVYYVTEAVQAVTSVVGSIVLVGALTRCALFLSVSDLKAAYMKLQHSLI